MLVEIATLLLKNVTKSTEDLISFRTEWSKNQIFAVEKKTNHKPLNDNLYLNCNHTAQHSCWLIQDLLKFFEVDLASVTLIIHRSPKAEPKEVKTLIKSEYQNHFKKHLCNEKGISEEQADIIIKLIDEDLNKILSKITPSYNDFFLFDDNAYFYNYCKKVKDYIEPRMSLKERQPLIDSLDLLLGFYKKIKK